MAYDAYEGDTDDERRERGGYRDDLMDELEGVSTTQPVRDGGTRNVQPGDGNGHTPNIGSRDDALQRVQAAYSRAGVGLGETDAANMMGKNPEDVAGFESALMTQLGVRAGNNSGGVRAAMPQYSGGGNSGGGNSGLEAFMSFLQDRQASADAERAQMREILLSQLGQATSPVDPNSAALKPQLDAQRLAMQRSAERQRSQLAARAGAEGLGDSGFMDTGLRSIEQRRGESESAGIADVLGRELQQKRALTAQLLQMAVQSGDLQSAQALQAQMNAINSQLQDQQFNKGLDFNYDQLGQQGAMGIAGLNQAALLALLGAV